MLKVKDCIFREVVTAKRATPLKDIIRIFKETHYNILPVVDDDGRLVGKITLDEITSVFQPHSSEIAELLKTVPLLDTLPEPEIDMDYLTPEMGILVVADEIMSKQYFSTRPEDSIAKAYSIMKMHDTKLLMVIEEDNRLVGVVGMFDIIYSMFKEKGIVR